MKTRKILSPILSVMAMWVTLLAVALLSSCQSESRGFVLPDGDIEAGKLVFSELNCQRCHSIGEFSWTGSEAFSDPYVKLGGEVSTIKTYGELVTSVINPSHKIERKSMNDEKLTLTEGMSKMELYRYNEIMTVQELVDLVSYLQSEYDVIRPENPYPYAGY